MDRNSLLESLKACMGEAQRRGDMGASAVIEAAGADSSRVLRAVGILTDGRTFFETLLTYLGEKAEHPAGFYSTANISAQTWSQMQDRTHNVSKVTVFRAALALKLDYLDAAILMEKAGYTFRSNDRMDMIMTCMLRAGIYDHGLVDKLLDESNLPTLFSSLD